jgi:hypothetical protein
LEEKNIAKQHKTTLPPFWESKMKKILDDNFIRKSDFIRDAIKDKITAFESKVTTRK